MKILSFALLLFCLTTGSALAQPDQKALPSRDSLLAAAREIIGMQKYCALITLDSVGHPHARTMNPFPPEEDMTVWIATNSRSRKVQEIRKILTFVSIMQTIRKLTGMLRSTGKRSW